MNADDEGPQHQDVATWYSVHVYYHGRLELLLTECIGPIVSSMRTRGVSRWFFLRHSTGGPHVRVRFQLAAGTTPAVKDTLTADIGDYLREKPSTTPIAADHLASFEDGHRAIAALDGEPAGPGAFYPDNTVIATPYVPEPAKYGGPLGVALAERFFEASSDLVITLLSREAGNGHRPASMAFAMMLAGLRAAGYGERDIAAFFAAYARFWQRCIPPDAWQSWLSTVTARPDALRSLSDSITRSDGSAGPAWMEPWVVAFGAAAKALHEQAIAIEPAVTLAGPMDPIAFVLCNYLHTHNNRLGVSPALEARLAYLGSHIMGQHD